jgi:hypothetical protein
MITSRSPRDPVGGIRFCAAPAVPTLAAAGDKAIEPRSDEARSRRAGQINYVGR